MKYLLNETNKFILNEKFNLTEAAYAIPQDILNILNSYLKLIQNYSKEDLQAILDKLDQYKDKAQQTYNTAANNNLSSLNQTTIDSIKQKSLDTVDSINKIQAKVSNFIETRDTLIANMKQAKKVVNNIIKLFNSWNLPKAQLDKVVFNKNFNKVFKDVLNLNLINSLPTKIIDDNNILKATTAKQLNDSVNLLLSNIQTISDNLVPKVAEAATTLEDIYNNAKNYKYTETQDSLKSTNKENWAELINQAAESDYPDRKLAEIWENYYKTEWAPKDKIIKNLGATFTQELLALSFDAALNPFVYFLQQTLLYNNPQELDINFNNYAALHNAYIKDYISDDDFRGNGFLSYGNIIFNTDLYHKRATEILSYLKLQKIIKDRYASNKAADYFKDPTLKALYGKNSKSFMYHLFNKNKSALAAEDTKVTNKNLQTMQLKDLDSIQKELQKCFNYSSHDDIDKATWTNSTGADIISELRNKDAVINALKYLSTVYSSDDMEKLLAQYKETTQDKSYNIGYNKKFNSLFSKYAISNNNATQVAADIIKAAGLTKI